MRGQAILDRVRPARTRHERCCCHQASKCASRASTFGKAWLACPCMMSIRNASSSLPMILTAGRPAFFLASALSSCRWRAASRLPTYPSAFAQLPVIRPGLECVRAVRRGCFGGVAGLSGGLLVKRQTGIGADFHQRIGEIPRQRQRDMSAGADSAAACRCGSNASSKRGSPVLVTTLLANSLRRSYAPACTQ